MILTMILIKMNKTMTELKQKIIRQILLIQKLKNSRVKIINNKIKSNPKKN